MIKNVSDILKESAELDKDILDIMDESVPAFEYTSSGLEANYLEGENFISEAYADLMSYKAQANEVLVESMGSMNEASIGEMRRMIDETLASKAQSIGFKVAQLFRALAKKVQTVVLGGQLKQIAKKISKLDKASVNLEKSGRLLQMVIFDCDAILRALESVKGSMDPEAIEDAIVDIYGRDIVDKAYANFSADDIVGEVSKLINHAKKFISDMNTIATKALKAESPEEAAKLRKISSGINKLTTIFLKNVALVLKAFQAAAKAKSAAKGDKPAQAED